MTEETLQLPAMEMEFVHLLAFAMVAGTATLALQNQRYPLSPFGSFRWILVDFGIDPYQPMMGTMTQVLQETVAGAADAAVMDLVHAAAVAAVVVGEDVGNFETVAGMIE